MADTGKELAELIHEDFKRRLATDKWSQRIIREGAAASMSDVGTLANQLGYHLSAAVSWHISDKELPLGEEMEEIARQILEPLLQQNYELINRVADDAQRRLDKARGINIEPQHPNFPRERADTVYKSAAEPGKSQDVIKRRMTVPPENITRNMSDSYMKANAELRSKAGFETYIVRTDDGNCCPWCAKLVGRYVYPEGVPKDVFRRHDNCGCRVVYECGNMRQNVHSKETWEQSSADIPELVKNPDVEIPELVRNPDYHESELYRANALTNEAESGIIKSIEDTVSHVRNDVIPSLKTDTVVKRQDVHRKGTKEYIDRQAQLNNQNQYGPPYVTISNEEIVELVNEYKGTGELRINKNGEWTNQEIIIDNNKIVGVVVNNLNGKEAETSVFKIHYSKSGIHIVPDYPSKKRGKRNDDR